MTAKGAYGGGTTDQQWPHFKAELILAAEVAGLVGLPALMTEIGAHRWVGADRIWKAGGLHLPKWPMGLIDRASRPDSDQILLRVDWLALRGDYVWTR